jgi:hypothetical protein
MSLAKEAIEEACDTTFSVATVLAGFGMAVGVVAASPFASRDRLMPYAYTAHRLMNAAGELEPVRAVGGFLSDARATRHLYGLRKARAAPGMA